MTALGSCLSCRTPIAAGALTCPACSPTAPAMSFAAWHTAGLAFAITVASYLALRIFASHVGVLGLALFYGSLSAAFFAREHAVVQAALGGVAGSVAVLFVIIVDRWEKSGPLLGAYLGLHEPSLGVTLMALVPVALVALLPITLIGAAIGELLAQRHRPRA